MIVLGTKGVKGEDTVDPRDQIQNRGIQKDQRIQRLLATREGVKVQGYRGLLKTVRPEKVLSK